MFAVIEISGKQDIVKEGDILEVFKVKDIEDKKEIELDKVLCIFDEKGETVEIGNPYIPNKKIKAIVLDAKYKGEKLQGAKFKPKKRYLRLFGHRQEMTKLQIGKIA